MKNKLLLCLLVLAFAVCAVALAENNAEWEFDAQSGAVTAYRGAGGDVTVPAEINGVSVRSLRYGLFNANDAITSITLPDTLEAIGANNFFLSQGLTELTVPAGVAFIDRDCFAWNDNLKSITFEGAVPVFGGDGFSVVSDGFVCYVPDDQLEAYRAVLPENITVTGSGKNAINVEHTADESEFDFDAATGTVLRYHGDRAVLTVPAQIGGAAVKAIGDEAFYGCRYLYYVALPEGVETIGARAFKYCSELYAVDLPDSLRVIGEEAFLSAWNAPSASWPAALEEIGTSAFGWTYLTGEMHFEGRALHVGERAFESSRVQELYLDDGGVSIGSRAFQNSYLNYLCINSYALLDGIAADAFAGASYLADLDLPWDSSYENQQAWRALMAEQAPNCYVWINNPPDCSTPARGTASYAEYPDGTLYLASYTGDQESLVMFHTMDNVQITGIGDGVFKNNQTLKKFRATHSDQFTAIGAEAFAGSAVETVDLYYTTETIGARAFADCLNLKQITLPASLKSIGAGAFAGCANLEKVTVNCDPALLSVDQFAGCTQLDLVALFNLTEMPYAATAESDFEFDVATGTITAYLGTDTDVVIPRSIGGVTVTGIGYNAFERCRVYADTDIANNQTTWQPLRSVVIPETVTAIADSAFSYCQQLELVLCYAPLASTGRGTFSACRNLETVVFVNGVSEIDNYAFEGCELLDSVYWGDHLRRIGVSAFNRSGLERAVIDAQIVDEGAFNHCEYLWDITLTDRVQEIHAAAFSDCEQLYNIACDFSEVERFVDGGPFGGIPQTGVTTVFPEATTTEQLNALNGKLNIWNGGHLGNGNEITLATVNYETAQLPDVDALYQSVISAAAPEAPTASTEPVELPEPIADISDVLGDWIATEMTSGGEAFDPAAFGLRMTLTLNADGTGAMTVGEESEALAWYQKDGVMFIGSGEEDELPVGLENGQLIVIEGGDRMTFTRGDAADESAAEPVSEPAAAFAAVQPSDGPRTDVKYLAVSYSAMGYTMDAAMLGAEYSLTFFADGTCQMIQAGYDAMPGMTWKINADGSLTLDYMGVISYAAEMNGENIDLDFSGAMILTMAPQE